MLNRSVSDYSCINNLQIGIDVNQTPPDIMMSLTDSVDTGSCINLLESLAVVDDGNHVLHVTLRQLSVSQVILFVEHRLLSVPAHNAHDISNSPPITLQ